MSKKERKLNESQFKQVVRQMARKAIKEHVEAKRAKKKDAALKESKQPLPPRPQKPKAQKITKEQLREMVRDSILECLEEELDKRVAAKKTKK